MMKYEMTKDSVFPMVEVSLRKGESIQLENGAMVYHNGQIELEGRMNGSGNAGLGRAVKALGRSLTSGENFFITKATGKTDTAKIALAPSAPGSIKELKVGREHWLLNTGTFLACDMSVSYSMKRQKLSGAIFGGTGGLFVMESRGQGSLLVNSYGDIIEVELDGSSPFVVDNQHVVAWSNTLDYSIKMASGIFGFKTGEGVVNEFHGQGTLMIQTRNAQGLASMIEPYIT